MSTQAERQLETAALDGHRRGLSWGDFWTDHGAEVCAAEPHDRRKFHKLVRRLLALVASGNTDGRHPVAVGELWGEDWEADDALG